MAGATEGAQTDMTQAIETNFKRGQEVCPSHLSQGQRCVCRVACREGYGGGRAYKQASQPEIAHERITGSVPVNSEVRLRVGYVPSEAIFAAWVSMLIPDDMPDAKVLFLIDIFPAGSMV